MGAWQTLPIGLSQKAIAAANSPMQLVTAEWVHTQHKPRGKFSHKGTFGHALLIAGAHGTVGAAILAARACLRGGAGLLTVHSPQCAYVPLQTAIPEAMVQTDTHERSALAAVLDRQPKPEPHCEHCYKQLQLALMRHDSYWMPTH